MIANIATIQIAGVLAGMGVLIAAPPREGAMLLIPVDARASVASIAVAHGAQILSRGPVAGSIVVRGRLADLAQPLLAGGVLPLAAPAGICGDGSAA